MIMGHQSCGAVKATVEGGDFPANIISIAKKIAPAVEKVRGKNISKENFLPESVAENVRYQMEQALAKSDVLKEMTEKNELKIIGGVYSLETGKVEFFDAKASKKKLSERERDYKSSHK